MHRIDSADNVAALPAPNVGVSAPGYFANNVGAAAGTVVDPDWLNSIQEELAGVVLAAGAALDKADNGQVLAALRALFGSAHGQCQLRYVSNVALVLAPFNGNQLKVNGKLYALPAAGIAVANTAVEVSGVANQNLAASTDYLLYLKDNGAGNLVPSFWPVGGGHVTDVTAGNVGVEVRLNGALADSTRTLVGMVGTDAAAHFSDADGSRLVLSWFNRRDRGSRTSFGSTPSTSSGTPVELSTSIRGTFLCWSGDIVPFSFAGIVNLSAGNDVASTGISFDGAAGETEGSVFESYTGSVTGNPNFSGRREGLAEGRHYATILGAFSIAGGGSAGAASWNGCVLGLTVKG